MAIIPWWLLKKTIARTGIIMLRLSTQYSRR